MSSPSLLKSTKWTTRSPWVVYVPQGTYRLNGLILGDHDVVEAATVAEEPAPIPDVRDDEDEQAES